MPVSGGPVDGAGRFGRRGLLQGALAAGLAGGLSTAVSSRAAAAGPGGAGPAAAQGDWSAFDRALQSAFDQMRLVGAAVALVSADRVVHTLTLGDRSLAPRRKVTNGTHFNVASTTKSMSALLAATYVDQGLFAWDQKVVDVWSGFRAPTDALTNSIRVRDLFGMATGIAEESYAGAHQGDPTAAQVLQEVVNLPVIASPNTTYFYNNTVFTVGGYLPFLATKVAPADLSAAYANAMLERVFRPSGMTGTRILDDPRGLVDDFATPNGLNLSLKAETIPFAPVGAYAPVGGANATLDDMAAYVRLQLRKGLSVGGKRVVSAANLAELWKPHIDTGTNKDLDPSAVSSGYGMGWIHETYTDGTSLTWHNGGIDGFTTFMGFLPERDLGLVVLNNLNTTPNGVYFYTYALNLLLQQYSLNVGVPQKVLAASSAALDAQRALGVGSVPVDPQAVEPYLGYYEAGYSVIRSGRDLEVHQGPRVLPLAAKRDGSYVVSQGLFAGLPARFARESDGTVHLELTGLETVRRNTGL